MNDNVSHHYRTDVGVKRLDHGIFYVEREALLVAFDMLGQPRGYLGPANLELTPEKPQQRFARRVFHRSVYVPGKLVVFEDAIYEVTDREHIASFFSAPAGKRIVGVAQELNYEDEKDFAVVTDQSVLILRPSGALRFKSPLPRGLDQFGNVKFSRLTEDRYAVWQKRTAQATRSETVDANLIRVFSQDGSILANHPLPALRPYSNFGDRLWFGPAFLGGLVTYICANEWTSSDLSPESITWTMGLVGLASAVVVLFLCRRYRFSGWNHALWGTATFLLGPLSLLTFLCLYEPPVREVCHTCGRKRIVTKSPPVLKSISLVPRSSGDTHHARRTACLSGSLSRRRSISPTPDTPGSFAPSESVP